MKGPGIKDYLNALKTKKEEAIEKGEKYLDINSKMFHAEISPEHATMPTCCQAMYKLMLENDEIIEKPKGNTGFGSHLTIRFFLEDMDNRERVFPDKKRGRPCKSEEEKLLTKKRKKKCNNEDLCNVIKEWLNDHECIFIDNKNTIKTSKENEKWTIHIQGIKRGRKQTLPVKLSEVLKEMNEDDTRYSVAFNDSITYRRQWNEIPEQVKRKLNLSILLVDRKGNVHEL